MPQVKLAVWLYEKYSDPAALKSDMLRAVVVWDEKTNMAKAVWDLSFPEGDSVSPAYSGFYGLNYCLYTPPGWLLVPLPRL